MAWDINHHHSRRRRRRHRHRPKQSRFCQISSNFLPLISAPYFATSVTCCGSPTYNLQLASCNLPSRRLKPVKRGAQTMTSPPCLGYNHHQTWLLLSKWDCEEWEWDWNNDGDDNDDDDEDDGKFSCDTHSILSTQLQVVAQLISTTRPLSLDEPRRLIVCNQTNSFEQGSLRSGWDEIRSPPILASF